MFHIQCDLSSFTKDEEIVFQFEHRKCNQEQFEQLANLLKQYRNLYATWKFKAGKMKKELNLPMKAQSLFLKKQRSMRIPLQLKIHKLLQTILHHCSNKNWSFR